MSAIATPILNPFAWNRIDNVPPPLSSGSPDNIANQETGFPVLQMTALSTPGAIPVKEQEMNGVLNYYTQLLFQLGAGYQFTFNNALAGVLGGYPAGTVLWNAVGNNRQVSLIPNNTYNFVANPGYINDGIHWKTVTDTPSIINPNTAFLESICTSTIISSANSVLYQRQITSADATNNLMESIFKSEDLFAGSSSQLFSTWLAVGIVAQPKIGTLLLTKDTVQRGLVAQAYVNSLNQLEYDMILYSNYGSKIIDSGIVLKQGYRPYLEPIDGSVTSLTTGLDSIMCFRDVKLRHYSDSTVNLNLKAIWNGTVWGVTMGGTINFNGGSTTAPTVIYSLTTAFGIVGANGGDSNIGLVSATPVMSSIYQITGEIQATGTNLSMSAFMSQAVTSASWAFTIEFQCTSLT